MVLSLLTKDEEPLKCIKLDEANVANMQLSNFIINNFKKLFVALVYHTWKIYEEYNKLRKRVIELKVVKEYKRVISVTLDLV